MQRRSIYGLVSLGRTLRYLIHCQSDARIANWEDNLGINGAISDFLDGCGDYNLRVTLNACDTLRKYQKGLRGERLDDEKAGELTTIMLAVEKTLEAETQGISSFFVTEKHIPIEKLTDSPEELLPGKVFSEMSRIAQIDFLESTLCLAFNRATAAAFHVLRATEAVLREYYCGIVRKQDRVKFLTWGAMLAGLRKRTRRKPDETMLDALDYIVKNFRNPTAHPEKIYSIDEAYEVFNLCVGAIPRIMRDKLWKYHKPP